MSVLLRSASSCLWKARFSKDKTVIIFGSIHLPADSIKWNRDLICSLISSSDYYVGELDLGEVSKRGFSNSNLIQEGKSISSYFPSHRSYDKSRSAIWRSFGLDLDHHRHLLPMLVQHLIDHKVSGGKEDIMDQQLWDYATFTGKPCRGIESLDDQISVLKSIDIGFQIRMLKAISSNTASYRLHIRRLIRYYEHQDIRALYLYSCKSTGKYRKLMIHSRNITMAQRILAFQGGNYFVCVGVAHLYGNKGIISLLKKSGIKLFPLGRPND